MNNRFSNYRQVFGGLLLSWVGLTCTPASATDLVTLAGGEIITSSDLSQYLDRRVDMRGSARNKWGVEKILREMAVARTLVQEGVRMGEPRLPGKESDRFDDAYALTVFRKLAPPCDPPADGAAARKFYDENPQAFRVPAMARLSRVMLPVGEPVEGVAVTDWLLAQVRAVAAGTQTFDAIVKLADDRYRLDPQGDLGWVTLVDENTILRTLAAAKPGDMVGPVREGDFVYLFSIGDKRDSRQLAWDEVAISASARAVSYCKQVTSKKLEEDLLSKYGVVMNEAGIKSLFDKAP